MAHSLPGRPTVMETQGKTTETKHLLPAAVYACSVSRWSIPGKILTPTNQIKELPVRAHVPRELRARALQDLGGYIKRVEQRTQPFRLGLAKV